MALERGKIKAERICLTKAKWMHGPQPCEEMMMRTE